jgi:transposase, IS30 family
MVLTRGEHSRARKLRSEGYSLREIGRRIGCSHEEVRRIVRIGSTRGMRVDRNGMARAPRVKDWVPGPGRLTLADREEISLGIARGDTLTAISIQLGKAVSTVSREVQASGGRDKYRAWKAHERAAGCVRRPKARKLSLPRLAAQVTTWLEEWWSPEEIALRLRTEFPDDPMMRVSHETIYQTLFVQGRGELRRELTRCLRSGRTTRKQKKRVEARGHHADMVMISDRPAEAADRAVPGHWEGDLIIGKAGASAVGTLVERTTRYVLLLHLPDGRSAEQVNAAMKVAISTLPGEMFRTITWDQGSEMSRHANFTIDTGIQIYFCDPHSPWQRGSNENTNGLLRQYMPKGTDLSLLSAEDLARFSRSLNNRPRKTLGIMKPSEKLAELLALTG